ncbi:hypothetical protein GCM10010916_37730 [Paenibacillus abyssi]|uniref:Uncharacterized protein n=1 Tax=Paenibacillus abyssi TaxID=1340531 RepID=A0A917LF80_9BACL|nr:hypothetical protein GCM10010916_37730 [Paenibacillus abyssi]
MPLTFEVIIIYEYDNRDTLNLERKEIRFKAEEINPSCEVAEFQDDNIYLVYLRNKRSGNNTLNKGLSSIFVL